MGTTNIVAFPIYASNASALPVGVPNVPILPVSPPDTTTSPANVPNIPESDASTDTALFSSSKFELFGISKRKLEDVKGDLDTDGITSKPETRVYEPLISDSDPLGLKLIITTTDPAADPEILDILENEEYFREGFDFRHTVY